MGARSTDTLNLPFDPNEAPDGELDDGGDDDWADLMCSLGPDGQCGQAGSEFCDFECPHMWSLRTGT